MERWATYRLPRSAGLRGIMLSPTRFESINGHAPIIIRDGATGLYTAECSCACGKLSLRLGSALYASENEALRDLLGMVLSHHGLIVMGQQNWACAICGIVAPLETDHILLRSHGRDDRVTNLRGLCIEDHRGRHEHS